MANTDNKNNKTGVKNDSARNVKKKNSGTNKKQPQTLTQKQKAFIDHYMAHGNSTKAYIEAGYSVKNKSKQTIYVEAGRIFHKPLVAEEITRRQKLMEKESIATAQDVMEFFTKAMNGEIKDQFGLDASLGDRIKAGQELARRTIDLENRLKGTPDATVAIKVDWKRDDK